MKKKNQINLNIFLKSLFEKRTKKYYSIYKNESKIFKKDFTSLKIREFLEKNYKKSKKLSFLGISFYLPLVKFGKTNSLDGINSSELRSFYFFYIMRNKYKTVADVGANIGLHSIFLSKLNYKTVSFEPNLYHFKILKKNIKKNKVKVKAIRKGLSGSGGDKKFVNVNDHTMGSHIIGSKKKPYGNISYSKIKTIPFKQIMKKFDLIKIDAEGAEKEMILSTNQSDWNNTDAIVEIHSKNIAYSIWKRFNKKLNFYSEKNFKKIKNFNNFPKNYTDGMVIISKSKKLFDNIFY